MGVVISGEPINLLFGLKLINLGLRKADKEYLSLKRDIENILQSYIDQERKKLKEGGKLKSNIIELLMAENDK